MNDINILSVQSLPTGLVISFAIGHPRSNLAGPFTAKLGAALTLDLFDKGVLFESVGPNHFVMDLPAKPFLGSELLEAAFAWVASNPSLPGVPMHSSGLFLGGAFIIQGGGSLGFLDEGVISWGGVK